MTKGLSNQVQVAKNEAANVCGGVKGKTGGSALGGDGQDVQDGVVRKDVISAMEESETRNKQAGLGASAARKATEGEFTLLHELIVATVRRDDVNRRHNATMRGRRGLLTGIGLIFLLCPILVAFDGALTAALPRDAVVDVLRYMAQERGVDGDMARGCLHLVSLAREVAVADRKQGHVYMGGCLGALMLLLVGVRFATRCRAVLSMGERGFALALTRFIREELQRGCCGGVSDGGGIAAEKLHRD